MLPKYLVDFVCAQKFHPMPLAKQTLCTVSDHFAEPRNCLGSISPLQLLEENQSLVSHPPLVCGHLETVYLEKNNNLFYSCWGWKTFCPPKRKGLIGISGRELVFCGRIRVLVCVFRCWSMLVLYLHPGVLCCLGAVYCSSPFSWRGQEKSYVTICPLNIIQQLTFSFEFINP